MRAPCQLVHPYCPQSGALELAYGNADLLTSLLVAIDGGSVIFTMEKKEPGHYICLEVSTSLRRTLNLQADLVQCSVVSF